jgi:DNA-directed RNA polymerase subunit RPC12/RpoP
MGKKLTVIDFMQMFSSEESCKTHLAAQKWGNGFVCRRCGSNQTVKGRTRQHDVVDPVGSMNRPRQNTLFHRIKFPLPAALTMVHLLTTTKWD